MKRIKGTKVGDMRRIGCQLLLTEKQFIKLADKDIVLSSLMNELLSMYLEGTVEVAEYKLGRKGRSDDGTPRRRNGRPIIPVDLKTANPEEILDVVGLIKKNKAFERAVRSIVISEIERIFGK